MKLLKRITLHSAVFALFIALSAMASAYFFFSHTVKERAISQQTECLSISEVRLLESLDSLQVYPGIAGFTVPDNEIGYTFSRRQLQSVLEGYSEINAIAAADSSGEIWFSMSKDKPLFIDDNIGDRPIFQSPLRTGSGYVAGVQRTVGGDVFMDISTPMYNPNIEGSAVGVSVFRLSLEPLNTALTCPGTSGERMFLFNTKTGDLVLGDMDETLFPGIYRSVSSMQDDSGVIDKWGESIAYSRFSYLNLNLTLASVREKAAVMNTLNAPFAGFAAITLFASLAGIYFFFISIKGNFAPLREALSNCTAILGRIEAKQTRSDNELETIAAGTGAVRLRIESLLDQLERMEEEIEERVKLRTESLQALVSELEGKLEDEAGKSVRKDQLMVRQSRLAAMGEMISNIAHQWRQPLNALALTVQDIEDTFRHGGIDEDYIVDVVENSMELIQHMSTTIDDFRNFYRTNKEVVEFDVREAVDEAVNIIHASLDNFRIELIMDAEDGVMAKGFPNEFAQVVLNLLSNAKDAVIENRRKERYIKISIASLGEKSLVRILDNGGGIPEQILVNVFEPYFTTKEQGKGTGIGLYMSKMIIENNMGGNINIENREHGTEVSIVL